MGSAPSQGVALIVALLASLAGPCEGQVYPSAPQSPISTDGIDAPGFVRVPATGQGGLGGFVDVPAYGACRFVTVGEAGVGGEALALQSVTNWLRWRTHMPPGDTQEVCCRAQTVTMCQGAAGGTVAMTLPYSVLGQTQQPVAQCTDQWGKPYEDTQTWVCGQTGSGVMADGNWQKQGGDGYTCAPNAYVGGCTASCGGGTQTTYDSCGNVQAVTACNTQACCTTDYVKSCSGATATYTDLGTCHSGSFTVPEGCTFQSYSCSASCSPSFGDTIGPDANGCVYNYDDCWASGDWLPAGATNCQPTSVWCEPVQISGCSNPAENGPAKSCGAVTAVSCTCGGWE